MIRAVIPLWLKISYTLFVCLLMPIYWRHYGPANFLWFSDIALIVTVPALWLESSLLASMMAVAVALPELAWNVDFFVRLATGAPLMGLSAYMFDRGIPRFIRALSLFHVGLPLLLLWTLRRLGYDKRALIAQTLMAMIVLPLSYGLSDPRQNVNWVYGFGERPQTRVPALWFLTFLIVIFPLAIYLPTHFVLDKLFAAASPG
ncbi:MAG TPA: membrane-associated protein [Candidatus Binatia bacterium]|jgi:hypothetical protein